MRALLALCLVALSCGKTEKSSEKRAGDPPVTPAAGGAGGEPSSSAGAGGEGVEPLPEGCGEDLTPCAADEYCRYELGQCAAAPDAGTCQPRPESCPDLYSPVCACDGQSYDNDCEARRQGVDLAANGACHTASGSPGWLPCGGDGSCNAPFAYCQVLVLPDSGVRQFSCEVLADACMGQAETEPDPCACFPADTPCLAGCSASPIESPGGTVWGYTLACAPD